MNRRPADLLQLVLCLVVACAFVACATTPQTAVAVTTAGAAAVAGIVEAVRPFLSDEQFARLAVTADTIDGTVGATRAAVGAIADAVAALRHATTEQAATIAAQAAQLAEAPTTRELYA